VHAFHDYFEWLLHHEIHRLCAVYLIIRCSYKLDLVSCGKNWNRVRKAIVSGFFMNAAKKDPTEASEENQPTFLSQFLHESQGYRTLSDGQIVYLHPSSSL
jgi:ATP-dependent RNA helicase DHX8/PRP22